MLSATAYITLLHAESHAPMDPPPAEPRYIRHRGDRGAFPLHRLRAPAPPHDPRRVAGRRRPPPALPASVVSRCALSAPAVCWLVPTEAPPQLRRPRSSSFPAPVRAGSPSSASLANEGCSSRHSSQRSRFRSQRSAETAIRTAIMIWAVLVAASVFSRWLCARG